MTQYGRQRQPARLGHLANQNDNSLNNYTVAHKPTRAIRVGDAIRAGAGAGRSYHCHTHDGSIVLAVIGVVLADGSNQYDDTVDPANKQVLLNKSEALVITEGDVWVQWRGDSGTVIQAGNKVYWDGEAFTNDPAGFLIHNSSFVTGTSTLLVPELVLLRLGTPASHQP